MQAASAAPNGVRNDSVESGPTGRAAKGGRCGAGDERRATNGGRRTAGDERRATNGGRRTAGDERRATNGGRRGAGKAGEHRRDAAAGTVGSGAVHDIHDDRLGESASTGRPCSYPRRMRVQCDPPTPRDPPRETRSINPQRNGRNAPVGRPPFVARPLSPAVRRPPLVARPLSPAVRRPPLVARRSSPSEPNRAASSIACGWSQPPCTPPPRHGSLSIQCDPMEVLRCAV
jgi:hypothetical protein